MESKRRVGVLEQEVEGGEGKRKKLGRLPDKYETIFGWMSSSALSTTKGMVYWVEASEANYRPPFSLKLAIHECAPSLEGEGSTSMCHRNQCLAQARPALAQPTNNITNLSSNFLCDYAQASLHTLNVICERNTGLATPNTTSLNCSYTLCSRPGWLS